MLTERQFRNLPTEVEARWRLVETAWELKVPRHVLTVSYDSNTELLVVNDRMFERKAITGCRDALNGYQKGKCFYCFRDISIAATSDDLADVDHFFPHTLKPYGLGDVIDGVWNLVLSCQHCNRGGEWKVRPTTGTHVLRTTAQTEHVFHRQPSPIAGDTDPTDRE